MAGQRGPARRALAGRALGMARVSAGRPGDRGHAGRPGLRAVRTRVDHGVPPGGRLRRERNRGRGRHAHRPVGHPKRRHPAWPGSRRPDRAHDRRPLRDRPGQSHRGARGRGDRRRRLDRSLRLHHRPEPRLRGPGHPDRQPVPGEPPGQHRRGLVAWRGRDHLAGRQDRPQRGGRGRRRGPWRYPRPVRGRRRAREDRPRAHRGRLAAVAPGGSQARLPLTRWRRGVAPPGGNSAWPEARRSRRSAG